MTTYLFVARLIIMTKRFTAAALLAEYIEEKQDQEQRILNVCQTCKVLIDEGHLDHVLDIMVEYINSMMLNLHDRDYKVDAICQVLKCIMEMEMVDHDRLIERVKNDLKPEHYEVLTKELHHV